MKNLERLTEIVTEFVGTPLSLILHTLWFALWFIFKADINLLTMLVSLEAIFLGIFIQMSVNRHHRRLMKHIKKGK